MGLPAAYLGKGKRYHSVNVSDEGTISLPVRLTRPASAEVKVNIAISGTRAIYGDTPEYGSAWVCGAGHTLSAATLTFAAGEIEKTANLGIVERQTPDNAHIPFIPETLRATLSIPEAYNSLVRLGSVGRTLNVLVNDDMIRGVINVKDYGAAGDGVTDETTAIKAAIAAAQALISNATTQQAVIYFPKGIYRVYYDIDFGAAITFVGEDKATTSIKRLDRQAFIDRDFVDEWQFAFRVTGVTTPPADGVFYFCNGQKYKLYTNGYMDGSVGVLVFNGVVANDLPPISGTLTKVNPGDTGDSTITYTGVTTTALRFTVSGVTVKPAADTEYQSNGNTYKVLYAKISGGSGWIYCDVTYGSTSPSSSGTLTKSNAGDGDASISYSARSFYNPVNFSFLVSDVATVPIRGDEYSVDGWNCRVVSAEITNGSGWLYVNLRAGSYFSPHSRSGTLTKASGYGQTNITYSNWKGEGRWWARIFGPGLNFAGATDSLPGGFRNITVSSNVQNYPEWYTRGYIVYEPCHTIKFRNGNSAGKYTFLVENAEITDKLSSNISTSSNSKLLFYNSKQGGGNQGKGMWSLVGGNITQEFKQAIVDDPAALTFNCLDVEQNSAVEGYYGDSRFTFLMEDTITRGVFQLGAATTAGTQTMTIRRSTVEDIYYQCPSLDVVIEDNCTINTKNYGSSYNYINKVKSLLVQNTVVNIYPHQDNSWYSGIIWSFVGLTGAQYRYHNCVFNAVGSHSYGGARCFNNNQPSNISLVPTSGTLILDTCEFNNFDWVVYTGNGGGIKFIKPTLVNCNGLLNCYGTATYPIEIETTGPINLGGAIFLLTRQTSVAIPQNVITHVMNSGEPTVVVSVADSLVMSGQADNDGTGIKGFTYNGKRRITGAGAPSPNVTGFPGDEYYDTVGAKYYDVLASGNMGWLKARDYTTYVPTVWTLRV